LDVNDIAPIPEPPACAPPVTAPVTEALAFVVNAQAEEAACPQAVPFPNNPKTTASKARLERRKEGIADCGLRIADRSQRESAEPGARRAGREEFMRFGVGFVSRNGRSMEAGEEGGPEWRGKRRKLMAGLGGLGRIFSNEDSRGFGG